LQELRPGESIPSDEQDLIGSGLIDSMGWVGILSALEDATGIRNFGNPWPEGRAQSIGALAEAVGEASQRDTLAGASETAQAAELHSREVRLVGGGYTLGSRKIQASTVEGVDRVGSTPQVGKTISGVSRPSAARRRPGRAESG